MAEYLGQTVTDEWLINRAKTDWPSNRWNDFTYKVVANKMVLATPKKTNAPDYLWDDIFGWSLNHRVDLRQ